jgi:hypothetical protein
VQTTNPRYIQFKYNKYNTYIANYSTCNFKYKNNFIIITSTNPNKKNAIEKLYLGEAKGEHAQELTHPASLETLVCHILQ